MKKTLLKIILTIILLNLNIKDGICAPQRPNIIFILTDDQREDTIQKYMPTVYKNIFKKGTVFSNAYATTPLCGPSRISIYTGLYSSEHGMHTNNATENNLYTNQSIARKLKQNGYFTGLVGKFHNTSNGKFSKNRKQEYNFWVSHKGGSARYLKTKANVNGIWANKSNQYITSFWNRMALEFIDAAKKSKKPFFLTLSHNAPHSPAIPDTAYKKKYSQKNIKLNSETFLNTSDTDKPRFVNDFVKEILNDNSVKVRKEKNIKKLAVNQVASLKTVDDGVKRIITKLKQEGLYNNTVIIFMSDNGLMWGEHCLTSKDYIYEEASHIPLAIYYPKGTNLFPKRTEDQIVANIDIAPTLAELAGIEVKDTDYSGVSLIKTVNNESDREGILLQGHLNSSYMVYTAYHTKDFIYAETGAEKYSELYDLSLDPYQTSNYTKDTMYEEIKTSLKEKFDIEVAKHDPLSCFDVLCSNF